MRYETAGPISRAEWAVARASGDPATIASALVRLAVNDADGSFVEQQCLQQLSGGDPDLRRIAGTP